MMKNRYKKRTLPFLDNELTAPEKTNYEAMLEHSPKAQRELEKIRWIRTKMREVPSSFKPFFAERVVGRLAHHIKQDELFAALSYMFRRVAIAGVVVMIILGSLLNFNSTATTLEDYAKSQMTLDELVDPTANTSLEDLI